MVFEEALYINGSQRKMLSIEDVTQLATNSLDLYNEIKNNLFCPECEKPHLTYNSCTTKSNYFSTRNLESHADTCSFKCKRATNHQLELLENDEKSLDRLQNRLKAVILSCFSEKKAARNPFVIENKISKFLQILKIKVNAQPLSMLFLKNVLQMDYLRLMLIS